MTLPWLVLFVVAVAVLHDVEVRRSLISRYILNLAARLLPKDARARYVEQWTADLRDTRGVLSRVLFAFDLFRAGAGVRIQLGAQGLSAGHTSVATTTASARSYVMTSVAVPPTLQPLSLGESPGGTTARLVVGVIFAVVVTTGLLWVMNYLIATTDDTVEPKPPIHWVDFWRVVTDPEPVTPDTPRPATPEPLPDALPRARFADDGNTVKVGVGELRPADIPLRGGISVDSFDEGDLLELVVVRPVYPPRAETRGIEGSCAIRYTVTRQGTVADAVVIRDQCTHAIFERASIDAALKFRYKPRVVNGVAVDVPGQMKKFTYVME